jgi:hydroxymethylpyrimidine pyrophosphatase-like HAD family hydrolase
MAEIEENDIELVDWAGYGVAVAIDADPRSVR